MTSMSLSAISALDIQSHLYASFLEGRTADVALRVSGRWRAIYRLHRVVLIQSDFFRSLFTAGFRESSQQVQNAGFGAEEINIVFDDSNITRAAFEICISRLYGGGPPLHIFAGVIPSTAQPLSPSFPSGLGSEIIPGGHHPATPRFLLSLLATSLYLSIPSVASQALSFIFKTISPYTVVPYLNFALGKSIDTSKQFWADLDAAAGLEGVAEVLEDDASSSACNSTDGSLSGMDDRLSSMDIQKEDISDISATGTSESSDEDDSGDDHPSSHHYGAISDKIGEACACWLVRWATDMLKFEQEDSKNVVTTRNGGQEVTPRIWRRGGVSAEWASAVVSADTLFVRSERARYDFARSVVELRRNEGVLESEERVWMKMFEEGIYYANMSAEDIIAISQDTSAITKRPFVPISALQAALWSQSLFRHQITSKSSSKHGQSPQQSSPSVPDKELGMAVTTAQLHAGKQTEEHSGHGTMFYYPVLGDSSLRIGENGNEPNNTNDSATMEDLFTFSHSPIVSPTRQTSNRTGSHKIAIDSHIKLSASEETFFGLKAEQYTSSGCIEDDPSGNRRWTPFPPCRFGVEFWDIDALKEKLRLHSHTIWYGGSLFNVYIQVVKKKGQPQLGIYLHRQSTIEPIPPASAPSPSLSRSKRESGEFAEGPSSPTRPPYARGSSLPSPILSSSPPPPSPALHALRNINGLGRIPMLHAATISPPSTPSFSPAPTAYATSSTCVALPCTSSPVTPPQPYRDPRSSISAYFTISCASATGSSQMRFTSAPDVFSVSQSWGWKTSALRTEEYMELTDNVIETLPANRSPINSLRATVVLGLI